MQKRDNSKETKNQGSMWDTMQKDGYFRNHAVYEGWPPEKENPQPVSKTRKNSGKKVLPGILSTVDFGSNEIIFSLHGDPLETFRNEIDPLLKETEEMWLQKIVRLTNEMTALDIGCGYGRTEEWLWHYVRKVYGVDISKHIIDICKERFKDIDNVEFYYNEGDNLSFLDSKQFDFVYCFNVIQHIPRPFANSYLKEIKRVLKINGTCLFNVLSGINYDVDNGPYGVEWAIGYRHNDMEKRIIDSGLKVRRTLKWRLNGAEPHWIWFLVSRS